jgi:hypothetical protein
MTVALLPAKQETDQRVRWLAEQEFLSLPNDLRLRLFLCRSAAHATSIKICPGASAHGFLFCYLQNGVPLCFSFLLNLCIDGTPCYLIIINSL